MESYLTAELIRALGDGDLKRVAAYGAIFLVIWLEVRGVKSELKKINGTISQGFSDGEKRFEKIEADVLQLKLAQQKQNLVGNQ